VYEQPENKRGNAHATSWPVFICYRQTDGSRAAEWLFKMLNGKANPVSVDNSAEDHSPILDIYYDQNAPAIKDWTELHEPYLKRARAFLLVCTPGAKLFEGEHDWVHREINWWIQNRQEAPILIDAFAAGERYIPTAVAEKWRNAQRIEIVPEKWDRLAPQELSDLMERNRARIMGGITNSAGKVYQQELAHQQERSARLSNALRFSKRLLIAVAALFLVAAGEAGYATWQSRIARSGEEAANAELLCTEGNSSAALSTAIHAFSIWETPQSLAAIAHSFPQQLLELRTPIGGFRQLAFAPDGKRIATGTFVGTVEIWNTANGLREKTLPARDLGSIESLDFTPDSRRVLISSFDGSSRVWNIETNEVLTYQGPKHEIIHTVLSPRGDRAITVSYDHTGRIWDIGTGETIAYLLGHSGPVFSGLFSPDSRYVATASEDGTARIWNANTGEPLKTLKGHSGPVYRASFSPDGQRILTASADKTARLWDVDTGQQRIVLMGHAGAVSKAMFSQEGQVIATASSDHTARLWQANSGKLIAKLVAHSGTITDISFGPQGDLVLTASADGTAKVWGARSGVLVADLRGHSRQINRAVFSLVDQTIATASEDGTTRLWNIEASGLTTVTLKGRDAVFSPDGSRILATSSDNTVTISNAVTGKLLASFVDGQAGEVETAQFSLKGDLVLTWGERSGSVAVWRADTGHRLIVLHVGSTIKHAGFSPSGAQVITAEEGGTVHLWSIATGKSLVRFTGHNGPVLDAAFSPDGQRVVTGSADRTVRVWDISTPHVSILGGYPSEVEHVRFSSDGKLILAVCSHGAVWVSKAATGEPVVQKSPGGLVQSAAFSHDGRRVLTALARNFRPVEVWSASTGETIATFESPNIEIDETAEFSPDNRRVLIASSAGVSVFDVDTQRMVAELLGEPRGHGVYSASFSSDGQLIASTGVGDDVVILRIITMPELKRLLGGSLVTRLDHFIQHYLTSVVLGTH
jgi:WD40 repeat protein